MDLNTACINGSLDRVKQLIAANKNIDVNMYRPLSLACINGHVDIVEYLITHGIYFDNSINYNSILRMVVRNGHFKMLDYLIKTITSCTISYDILLYDACDANIPDKQKLMIVKLLAESNAGIYIYDSKFLTLAARHGDLDVVKYLVESNANICADNDAALIFAAAGANYDVVKFLIDNNANIDAREHSLLFYIINDNNYEMVKYVINMIDNFDEVNDFLIENAYEILNKYRGGSVKKAL